jgi:hypothetical protein
MTQIDEHLDDIQAPLAHNGRGGTPLPITQPAAPAESRRATQESTTNFDFFNREASLLDYSERLLALAEELTERLRRAGVATLEPTPGYIRALGPHASQSREVLVPRLAVVPEDAERFIRTMLGGWAYGAIYRNSAERTAALSGWLERYNWRRPHGALNHKPPGARLAEQNNVLGSYRSWITPHRSSPPRSRARSSPCCRAALRLSQAPGSR